jgi:hypothetical protein
MYFYLMWYISPLRTSPLFTNFCSYPNS